MKEGDMLFESGVGKTLDGKWWWRARGLYVVEFCRTYTPEWQDVPDGPEQRTSARGSARSQSAAWGHRESLGDVSDDHE